MKITGKWQVMKMSNIWTIMKKEFDRFFKDKRMVISTLLLPGLMIYLVYTIMGTAMGSQFMTDEEYLYKIEVENMPSSIETFFGEEMFEVTKTETLDMETLAQKISDGDVDVAIVFDDNFDAAVKGGGAKSSDIAVYYNSTVTSSSEAYSVVTNILDTLEESIVDIFRINGDAEVQYDLSTKEEMAGFLLAMIMPMLLISFLFSGSMAVAPEAIAGEKERGTMATLLVTPVNRAHIAIGKVLSLSAISLLSGLSSFLGIILALPSYMESMMENVDMQVYGVKEYGAVLIVILSTVLLIVSVLSVISAFAKSVKEAGSLISPFMIVTMLLGITTIFGGGETQPVWVYFIPMYNSVQCFASIFNFKISIMPMLITVAGNIVYAVLFGFILTRMFNSEKIMFKK